MKNTQKGVVDVGDSVTAMFDADTGNTGASTVQVTFADYGGAVTVPGSCAAAPAGSCTTDPAVVAIVPGVVAVHVATTLGGTLTIFVNGQQRDSEHIRGATKWDYIVANGASAETEHTAASSREPEPQPTAGSVEAPADGSKVSGQPKDERQPKEKLDEDSGE